MAGKKQLMDGNIPPLQKRLDDLDEIELEQLRNEKPEPVKPVDITDTAALKTLAMEALVEIVQTAPRNVALVGAIRELIDRIEGKAPQSMTMTVKADPVSKLTDDQLAALLAHLPDPLIIPPMPKK